MIIDIMSLTFNAQDLRDIKDSFYKRELKYEYHSSIITYNKLGANFTRISTVIAVSEPRGLVPVSQSLFRQEK